MHDEADVGKGSETVRPRTRLGGQDHPNQAGGPLTGVVAIVLWQRHERRTERGRRTSTVRARLGTGDDGQVRQESPS